MDNLLQQLEDSLNESMPIPMVYRAYRLANGKFVHLRRMSENLFEVTDPQRTKVHAQVRIEIRVVDATNPQPSSD